MQKGKIHIGTSGWSYKHWKNEFYPEGMKPTDYLTYYAKFFDITEINTSFYHLPKDTTITGWAEKVPKKFKFCPKISRYITHIKRLKDPEQTLEKFFAVFEPMKEKLGPVLIQLPPTLKFDYDVAEHFYTVLREEYKGFQYVMEVRHETWLSDDSLNLMTRFDMGFVVSQSGAKFPYSEMVTAKNIYVRFHGPEALYASSYSDEQLVYFAEKFKEWVEEGHHIWAFFNNDVHGHAYENAKRLEQFIDVI
jgi:uncharacterized protein YecE (DUF72 family)